MPFTITPKADTYLRQRGVEHIRFGVRENKGCSGWEYIWEYGEKRKYDYHWLINDTYNIYIDSAHKQYLEDIEIDYSEHQLGNKVIFNNKKVDITCGCGESINFPANLKQEDGTWGLPDGTVMKMNIFSEDYNPWDSVGSDDEGTKTISDRNVLSHKYKQWREVK
jgi:iron-sulfur cluster assembly accessory protein